MHDKDKTSEKNSLIKLLIIFFIAVTAVAFFFPPTADDLGWATSDGMELLKSGFKDYNGRYLGNIFAIAFTKAPYLLPFIKGFTFTGILYLIFKISSLKNERLLYVTAVLLMLPTALFKQAFVWTAGFSNYYFSALVVLASLYILIYKNDSHGIKKAASLVLIFILGVAGQLFMETFTIFTLVSAVAILIYRLKKTSKPDLSAVVYFVACVLGAVIMFGNSAYSIILNGESKYQTLNTQNVSAIDSIVNIIKSLCGNISFNAIRACFPAIIVIVALSIVLMNKNKEAKPKMKRAMLIAYSSAGLSAVAFAIVFVVTGDFEKAQLLSGAFLLVLFVAVGIAVSSSMDKASKTRVLIYASMIAVQCAPLCVVNPVGPRCFSGSYVLLIMIIGEMLSVLCKDKKGSAKGLKTLLIIVLAMDIICYSIVFIANQRKVNFIRAEVQNGATQIEVSRNPLKFMAYSLDIEDKGEKYKRRFCEYYDLPEDIEITYR